MEVTDALIDKLSSLCKLSFTGETREVIRHDLERMLDFVAQVQALDTQGVAPLIHLREEVNQLRPDVPGQPLGQTEALKNAPRHDSDYFRVPKVVSKD